MDQNQPSGAILEDLYCPHCGYNLRGIESRRCPECGEPFDPATLKASRLPWAHRQRLGRVRAYWRTVGLVMFRTGQVCREIEVPVSYSDARRFWLITTLHAYVPFLILTAVLFGPNWTDSSFRAFYALPLAVGNVGLMMLLLASTGVTSYFCHPRLEPIVRQNRAVALSYYGCAALAWTPAVVGLLVLGLLLSAALSGPAGGVLGLTGGCLGCVALGFWLANTVRIVTGTVRPAAGWKVGLVITLPALWVLLTLGAMAFSGLLYLGILLGLNAF